MPSRYEPANDRTQSSGSIASTLAITSSSSGVVIGCNTGCPDAEHTGDTNVPPAGKVPPSEPGWNAAPRSFWQ